MKTASKENKKKFLIVTAANLIVAFLDLFLTYLGTPDLKLEGNVLITELFLGWPALIAVNVIVSAGMTWMAYYAYIKYKPPVTNETDMKRYLAKITYGDADKTTFGMWKWPKYWPPQIACMCWAVTIAVPIARMLIVLEWFFIVFHIYFPYYFRFMLLFPKARADFFVAVILSWILSFVWIKREFNANLKRIEAEQS